jgi:hypothetical protein
MERIGDLEILSVKLALWFAVMLIGGAYEKKNF